ncbi:MAG: hypothetical protein ABSF50_02735 [Burkholderiaceae bacterium]|jgi:uncharacterized protein (DUF697 family)
MLPSSLAELDEVKRRCRSMVTRRASLSAGVAVVPVPGLDIGTDVMILMRLLPKINREFGLSPEQIAELDAETKKIVMVLASAAGSELIGRIISKELVVKVLKKFGMRIATGTVSKVIPVVGQALSASISFGAMKMLGNAHIEDCYLVARRALEAAEEGFVIEMPK